MYAGFLKEFAADEALLQKDPDFSAKISELAKQKQSELRKYDKTVKRELNEVEDLFAAAHSEKQLQALQERIAKTLSDVCRKAAKKCQ